jgi:hypothetical protein
VTVDYCAGYLRAQENFMLSIPEARAAGMLTERGAGRRPPPPRPDSPIGFPENFPPTFH